MGIAHREEEFYDGGMKNPRSTMISCNDGFHLVSFLWETIDRCKEDGYVKKDNKKLCQPYYFCREKIGLAQSIGLPVIESFMFVSGTGGRNP